MGYTHKGRAWEWRSSWFLVFFLTWFLYWVPLLYMGLRVLQLRWAVYAALYAPVSLLLIGALLFRESVPAQLTAYLWRSSIAFFIFAAIHTYRARGEFLVRLAEAEDERDELAQRQRVKRDLAATGERPRPAAAPRKLNVNTVGETELAMLPGMGPERARQAVRLRQEQGEFHSFAHFAARLQLGAELQARLKPMFEAEEGREPLPLRKDDPAFRELPDGRRVLELNWASAEALAALPGLGPETARRAALLRDGDGPFKSIEDFRYRVGLSMDAINKISPYVSVISMSTRAAGGAGAKTGGRIVDA